MPINSEKYGAAESILLTETKLKELTRTILDLYRAKNEIKLRVYANSLFQEDDHRDLPAGKIFIKLVKVLHPDRLVGHLGRIEEARTAGDSKTLEFYRALVNLDVAAAETHSQRFAYDFTEEYGYGEEDFGYHREDRSSEYRTYGMDEEETGEAGAFRGEDRDDTVEVEFDFIHAVKAEFFGNLENTILPVDLASLEGELDLSGYGILDTEGLQYCRHISKLNLSGNRISNLFDLKELFYLRELLLAHNLLDSIDYLAGLVNVEILDISSNEIEDFSPLLGMEKLQFVDVRGNGSVNPGVLEILNRRGVVVLQ